MKNNLSGGYAKIFRSLLDWEWYDDSEMVHLMIHLILKANHKPGKWRGYQVARGQLITSLEHLSVQTGISVQSIRTRLNRLKSTNEITSESTNRFTRITVCNYDSYQDENVPANKQTNKPVNKQLTNNQQTNNKQLTTNKNEKNEKNEKNFNLFLKKEILNKSKIFFHALSMKHQVKKEVLRQNFESFYDIKYMDRNEEFTIDQVRDHFANWLETQKNKKVPQKNKKPGGSSLGSIPDNR